MGAPIDGLIIQLKKRQRETDCNLRKKMCGLRAEQREPSRPGKKARSSGRVVGRRPQTTSFGCFMHMLFVGVMIDLKTTYV